MSDWGKAIVNSINWGQAATNSIDWGNIYENSLAGDTLLVQSGFTNTYSLGLNQTAVDQFAECGNVTSLNGSAVASWSFWVKRDDVTNFEVPISQGGAGDDRLFYPRFVGNNRFDFYIKGAAMWKNSNLNVTFVNNTWYNIVVTYNGATSGGANKTNVYINGVKETNTQGGANITTLTSSTTNFNIGRHQYNASSYNNYFDGNIDEIAFFDKELSQSEVTAIAAGPTDLSDHDNIVNYWRMGDNDSGSGTTLTAAIGGVNGTLYNSASYESDVPA